jgi:periplasmic divalent cation tolerance protein
MSEARIVLTTTGSPEEARKIARLLVERQLAACVNIVPRVESIYRWQGAVEQAEEHLLVIKTTLAASAGVQKVILKNHSYEVPECICLPIDDGSEKYLQWINESVVADK